MEGRDKTERSTNPAGEDRRQHKREHIRAEVQVVHGKTVALLPARNVSLGGVYLEAAPDEHEWMVAGLSVELTVLPREPPDDGLSDVVRCRGRIIRRDPGSPGRRPPGIGVLFEELDAESRARLRAMIVATHRD